MKIRLNAEEGDYLLPRERPSAWVEVDDVSVYVRRDEADVVVELFPNGSEMKEALDSARAPRFSGKSPEERMVREIADIEDGEILKEVEGSLANTLAKDLQAAHERIAMLEQIIIDLDDGAELSEKEQQEIRLLQDDKAFAEADVEG